MCILTVLFGIEMLIFTNSWEHLVYQMGRTEDVIKHEIGRASCRERV